MHYSYGRFFGCALLYSYSADIKCLECEWISTCCDFCPHVTFSEPLLFGLTIYMRKCTRKKKSKQMLASHHLCIHHVLINKYKVCPYAGQSASFLLFCLVFFFVEWFFFPRFLTHCQFGLGCNDEIIEDFLSEETCLLLPILSTSMQHSHAVSHTTHFVVVSAAVSRHLMVESLQFIFTSYV